MNNKGRVLIVEDDIGIVTMIDAVLQDEGFETRNAMGEKALKLAEEYQPNLIILDIMMPVMDGLEWSNRAKANPKLKDIPILVLSAASADAINNNYKDLQATSYLPKPFEIERLIDMVYAFTYNHVNMGQAL